MIRRLFDDTVPEGITEGIPTWLGIGELHLILSSIRAKFLIAYGDGIRRGVIYHRSRDLSAEVVKTVLLSADVKTISPDRVRQGQEDSYKGNEETHCRVGLYVGFMMLDTKY